MKFSELFLKCHDASVFQEKNNHEILSKIFYDKSSADRILQQDQYFIIGEKGTGKTIIAQYLSNIRKDKNCSILDFSAIDFQTYRSLIDAGHLKLIQPDHIWQVILMVMCAEIVTSKEGNILTNRKFNALHCAIKEFYENRFIPEFPVVVQIIDKIDKMSALANKYIGEIGDKQGSEIKIETQSVESPLGNLRMSIMDAFINARISQDHVIFIDKIDIKPDHSDYSKFIETLRSFVRAALYLNENVFSRMKGRKRIKFALLLRPDIFDKLNLQNQSAKVTDNSVVLNWDTTYDHHRDSKIFSLADQFLGKQTGESFKSGEAWDFFVSPDVYHFSNAENASGVNKSFREFLRLSWFRPRDIIQSLHICQQQSDCNVRVTRYGFERSFKSFSDYLYGEVKDFSRFYFSDDTFGLIEKFFSEIQQKEKITYDSFRTSHDDFLKKIKQSTVERRIDPKIEDPDEFLQILYSSNIICWRMKNDFNGVDDYWAFRERTPAQLEPKVGLYCEYAVHYGLRRALRLGRNHVSAVQDK